MLVEGVSDESEFLLEGRHAGQAPEIDGKIYLANEDGEMLVVESGRTYKLLATNSMGETLMATPALSRGVMYVRGVSSLFAIGARP